MFESARLKLTAWYLVIIMAISLLFSTAIYSSINSELNRLEKAHFRFTQELKEGELPKRDNPIARLDPETIEDSRHRLIIVLWLINLGILFSSGIAGYFLAGRTLKPIKKMLDEQDRFVTDASHELRTPLTALRTEIEVGLRNKKFTLIEAKKLLESNLEEVINLQKLSDHLLDLSQNAALEFTEISLTNLINRALKQIGPLANQKQIKIKKYLTEAKINGDMSRLMEVLLIILDNAIKYSPEKSEIKISTEHNQTQVSISITDQGVGLAEEDIPHIFERFYQVVKSRNKDAASGYGLGLSIAKNIMEAHNGFITVESNLKQGSMFKLTFRKTVHN